MSTSILEKDHRFEFEDDWRLCAKWDGTPASRHQIFPGETPACVDLVGISGAGAVYLIEVKDHSQHVRENETPLFDVLRSKVHDTVMGVITAHRRGDTTMLCEPLARALVKKSQVYVVLHLEEPTVRVVATRGQRRSLNRSLLRRQHEDDFRWLNARLLVVDRDSCKTLIPGLSVEWTPGLAGDLR